MKTILCFGDSNTWGFVPVERTRYGRSVRWPGLMAQKLGKDYHVIEEGLNGRTTAFQDYLEPYRNGLDYVAPCIMTHAPFDLVIVMLGTNDTKRRYQVSSGEIANGMKNLIKKLRFYYPTEYYELPKILIAAPAPLRTAPDDISFDAESCRKIRELPMKYKDIARELGCAFFNAQEVLTEEDLGGDGLHLLPQGHQKLAEEFTKKVTELLG